MGFWDWLLGRHRKPSQPPAPKLRAVAVTVYTKDKIPFMGATVTLDAVGPTDFVGTSDKDGYVVFNEVPVTLSASHLTVQAKGYKPYSQHVDLPPVNHTLRVGDPHPDPTMPDVMLPPIERDRPPSELAGSIRVNGRAFLNDRGWFYPVFVSGFILPTLIVRDRAAAERFLDWAVETGFNGVRVFAGSLRWDTWNQTPEDARAGLLLLLPAMKERGLYCEITALTDTGTGYDREPHLRQIANIASMHGNAIIEVANEPYHGSQAEAVHSFQYLQDIAARNGLGAFTYALGAPDRDEPAADGKFPVTAGSYVTVHLNRGRDEWNMVRRVRELEGVSALTNKPVLNNEPIGWAEAGQAGRRSSNAEIAFAMGVLSRLFVAGVVSHAEHGLLAQLPGAVQQACHKALIAGVRSLPVQGRLDWKNSKRQGAWQDSPIDEIHEDTVIRVYTGALPGTWNTPGAKAWAVAVGIKGGDPQLRVINGWRVDHVIASRGGVQVVQLTR